MSPGTAARLALLAPMPLELRPLRRALRLERRAEEESDLWWGRAGRFELVAAVSGIGTRAAARAAERLLDLGGVERLLVVGIAGAIGPEVGIGDLVLPASVLDLASGASRPPTPIAGIAFRGILATGDGLLDPAQALELARRGVVAVDMETAAVAAVCEARDCAWSAFRAISDRADDGSTDTAILGLAGPDGRPRPFAAARFALSRPWRIPQLLRLARGAQLAADTAAAAALRAVDALQATSPDEGARGPARGSAAP